LARKRILAPIHVGQGQAILPKENKAPIAMLASPKDGHLLLTFFELLFIVNNYVRKIY